MKVAELNVSRLEAVVLIDVAGRVDPGVWTCHRRGTLLVWVGCSRQPSTMWPTCGRVGGLLSHGATTGNAPTAMTWTT